MQFRNITFCLPQAREKSCPETTQSTHGPLDAAEDVADQPDAAAEPRTGVDRDADRYRLALTGYWCQVCHLPRVPYPGDHGRHPTCRPEPRATTKDQTA